MALSAKDSVLPVLTVTAAIKPAVSGEGGSGRGERQSDHPPDSAVVAAARHQPRPDTPTSGAQTVAFEVRPKPMLIRTNGVRSGLLPFLICPDEVAASCLPPSAPFEARSRLALPRPPGHNFRHQHPENGLPPLRPRFPPFGGPVPRVRNGVVRSERAGTNAFPSTLPVCRLARRSERRLGCGPTVGQTIDEGPTMGETLAGESAFGRSAACRAGIRTALSHHQGAGRWRHGCRLPGVGLRVERCGRAEGHPHVRRAIATVSAGSRKAFQAGAPARASGHAQERRAHPRSRRDRRHQVHHDAVHPGPRPGLRPAARAASCRLRGRCDLRGRSAARSRRRTTPASCIAI